MDSSLSHVKPRTPCVDRGAGGGDTDALVGVYHGGGETADGNTCTSIVGALHTTTVTTHMYTQTQTYTDCQTVTVGHTYTHAHTHTHKQTHVGSMSV